MESASWQRPLYGFEISQNQAKMPLKSGFSDGLGWGHEKITVNCESVNSGCVSAVEISVIAYPSHGNS